LRCGGLLGGLQEGAEVFQFGDQAVLGGDHLVRAVALALEVRPVTGRTLFGLNQLASNSATLALSVATVSTTDW
jgi:hypothetical protein